MIVQGQAKELPPFSFKLDIRTDNGRISGTVYLYQTGTNASFPMKFQGSAVSLLRAIRECIRSWLQNRHSAEWPLCRFSWEKKGRIVFVTALHGQHRSASASVAVTDSQAKAIAEAAFKAALSFYGRFELERLRAQGKK